MSYNNRSGGGASGGYSRRGYHGSHRGGYRTGRSKYPEDRYLVGGMLSLNKGSHYESSDNRYIPNEIGSKSPENRSHRSSTKDGRTPSGLSTPLSSSDKVSTPISIELINGSDRNTGVNNKDSEFPKLSHHSDFTLTIPFSRSINPQKNFMVINDSHTPKTDKGIQSKKIRYNGEGVNHVSDPRIAQSNLNLQKPTKKTKKTPYKQLPQPKFVYNSDSLGPAPMSTIIIWDLPISTSEPFLRNFVSRYGNPLEEMTFITDPTTAVPLGIVTFKFQGNPQKASELAKNFIKTVRQDELKIDGATLKIALNDNENQLLNRKLESAKKKMLQQRLQREQEEEKRRQKLVEEQKKQELLKKKEKEHQESVKKEKSVEHESTIVSTRDKNLVYKPNSTVLSMRHNHKIILSVILPKDLEKYIKSRPYILIRDKYVPTKKISSHDIKRALKKYDWTRVLSDKSGFFIVFNSLNECERCFLNEDNKKFFEYKLVMEMAIPEGFTNNIRENELKSTNDVLDEATNILIKEFQTFLAKDIRERIIAPNILDLLAHDKYPELVEELKSREQAAKPKVLVTNNQLKENALSILEKQRQLFQQRLPSFRMSHDRTQQHKPKRRNSIIPMQHALNFDDDEDSESHSQSESEDEDEDETTGSRPLTPVVLTMKRERSSTITSIEDDIELEEREIKKQKVKVPAIEAEIAPESSPEEGEEEEKEEVEIKQEAEEVDIKFQPTEESPRTVYQEIPFSGDFDLNALQHTIKDSEDLLLAQEVLSETTPSGLSNIEYWSWKSKNRKDVQEISQEEEYIEELPESLQSTTGSFKSEGVRKIPEIEKIGYLPHRKRTNKPIKTIQYEDEDEEKPNENTNAVQSSRVNRANNRRFAADITAQIGSESDVLSLNALTKRKKPVTFARSAIHNWGLYAMEPIAAKEMIIEYVGERIRQQVAEHREKSYLKTGIGSSYLFRIDDNTVIDATKKGGIARFINHCCSPSCTAKIIKVEGKKRIVIYALRDIEANEELTYDYKFERETNDEERIRCLCGAPGCKGYLN